MEKPTSSPSDCFVFLLSKAFQKGQKLVKNRLQPYGLTNVQYLVLEVLWGNPGLTAAEIGETLTVDKATMSGTLDRMAEGEWIIKTHDETDKRLIRLSPSGKAFELRETLINERIQANETFLAGFTNEERILLRRMLLALK
ncbi:MarR family transcriptional regulator [bacterium]|nr:MarR family transcriptional regulator [bacterium]